MKKTILLFTTIVSAFIANAQNNPFPVLSIDSLQFVNEGKLTRTPPNDSSDYVNPVKKNTTYGDTVGFEGIVVFSPKAYGLSLNRRGAIIQRKGGGPWSGMLIMCEPAGILPSITLANLIAETKFYDNLVVGNKVKVTGVMRQFNGSGVPYGETQVNMIRNSTLYDNSIESISLTPDTIVVSRITIDSLMTGNVASGNVVQKKAIGEKWEGVYVEFRDVTVASRTVSGSRWNWSVIDNNGNQIDIRDFSAYYRNDANGDTSLRIISSSFAPPAIGARLSYLKGIITEGSAGTPATTRYWIAPLVPSDLGPVSYTPIQISNKKRIPTVATSSDSVLISAVFTPGTRPVKSGKLFYAVGYTNTVFTSANMIKSVVDPSQWYAFVPAQTNGSIVKYYIRATDSSDVSVNLPDTSATNSAYLVVDGGINSIQQLQFSPFKNHATIWHNDSMNGIDVRGIVTSTNMTQASVNILTIQNGDGPDAAIIINRSSGDATSTWRVGDSVSITACRVRENYNQTTLNYVAGSVISSGITLPATKKDLTIDSIVYMNSSATRRTDLCPWEGQILEFSNVYVVNKNADGASDFGEFLIHTDSTSISGLRVDDISTKLPDFFNQFLGLKQKMSYAKGVFYLSFSNWKLEPRDSNDLDFSNTPLPADVTKPVITLSGSASITIVQYKSYNEQGATATDDRDGNITNKIVKTGSVDTSKVGTYVIKYSVQDNAGNKSDTVIRTVTVTPSVGVNENEFLNSTFTIYPSPAFEKITIDAAGFKTIPATISITDLLGKEMLRRTINEKVLNETFDISAFGKGIYFCTISNSNGLRTIKFLVSGK